MEKWNGINYIGKRYDNYFVVYAKTRDSNILIRSNFNAILKRLGGESENVMVVRSNHWLFGWIEQILVHENDTEKLSIAEEIERNLSEYPILDEDDFNAMREEFILDLIEEIKESVKNGLHAVWDLNENPTDIEIREAAEKWVNDY